MVATLLSLMLLLAAAPTSVPTAPPATQPTTQMSPEQQAEVYRTFFRRLAVPVLAVAAGVLVVVIWLAGRARRRKLERGELPEWTPPDRQ